MGAVFMEEIKNRQEPDLEAFKEALKAEYKKRIEEIRAQYEQELSEEASKRRQEVELQVARLRTEQKRRYEKMLKDAQERILSDMRHRASSFVSESVGRALSKLEERLHGLRSDRAAYVSALGDLVVEALEVIGESGIVLVDEGESALVPKLPQVRFVEEAALGGWGGCMVTDAATKTRVVDNTLRTRWERAEKELRLLVSGYFDDVFTILERTAQQLRVS
ncbi:MAG TPA: hypothetical protein DCE03_04605 [Synergistaceae bacterium]|nr:hypothetical protein [Synergistaceae bacterium]